jgi:TRAP-type C4-dicarboxylate transport system substrate-binding protein
MRALVLFAIVSVAATSSAEPRVIKLAVISPEGTPWSREVKATAQAVEAGSNGNVRLKLYLGAVAGDETEVAERIGKGQLDGTVSGGVMCDRVSPTLRAIGIPGLFETREEALLVSHRLGAAEVQEAQNAGFALLGVAALGQDVLFTRTPVRSLDELKRLKLWRWDGDDAGIALARAMGLEIVPTPLHEAGRALEAGRVDGVMAIPMAALAFQWSTRTRYLTSLRVGHLNGCFLIANRAFDKLAIEDQQVLRAAVAKLVARIEELSRREDDALVGSLFARQGLVLLTPSPSFRAEFFAAAARARAKLGEPVVARAAVERVLKALGDVRAERGVAKK